MHDPMHDPLPQSPPHLDLKGLKCPLPVLRMRKALAQMASGARLAISVTDPMAVIDIPHALTENGDLLISTYHEGSVIGFLVEKG